MRSFSPLVLAALGAAELGAAASAGCGKTAPQSGAKSMTVNGKDRQYLLQMPNNYDSSKPYRLVFGYHWRGGKMDYVAQGDYYGLKPLSADSTIFIAPNGLNAGWANNGGEDIKFTQQMLDYAKSNLCIDEAQVFSTGWSYGGAMSHSIACSLPNDFAAVAVISGGLVSGCDGGTQPVPYLGIHGSADDVLPITSGEQLRDHWLGVNGCAPKTAENPPPGSGTHIKTTYTCSKAPVTWISHGGPHQPDPSDSNGNKWAPGETWKFFDAAAGARSNSSSSPSSSSNSSSKATSGSTGGSSRACASKAKA